MGQCTSAEPHRISSVPNTPQIENLPQIVNTSHQPILGTGSSAKKEGVGGGDLVTGLSKSSDDTAQLTTAQGQPIKGIRKLKPRRRGLFGFHQKQHVTFLTTPEQVNSKSIESRVPRRRIHLDPLPRKPANTALARSSSEYPEYEKPQSQECRSATFIMGNNVQKPARRDSKNVTQKKNLTEQSVISKPSQLIPLSKSSAAVLSCAEVDQSQEFAQTKEYIPSSKTTLDLSNAKSLAIAAELEASRLEKNLLRARFFSSPPSHDEEDMSANRFGFRQAPPAVGGDQPPNVYRTFQYHPPAPTKITPRGAGARVIKTDVHQFQTALPTTSSSLNQLPNLHFITSKTTQSKSAAAIPVPPPLIPPKRHQFTSSAASSTHGASNRYSLSCSSKSSTGFGYTSNSSVRISGNTCDNHGNGTADSTKPATAGSVTSRWSDGHLGAVSENRDTADKPSRYGFGWKKSSISKVASTDTSQVLKPPMTKPFYLLATAENTKNVLQNTAPVGTVAQKKFLFEPKKLTNLNKEKLLKIPDSEPGCTSSNHSTAVTTVSVTTTTNSDPTTTLATHDETQVRKLDFILTEQEKASSEEVDKGTEGSHFESLSSTTSKLSCADSTFTFESDDGHDHGPGQCQGQCQDPHLQLLRPRSGRSLSRERDTPISDSEYLIDDEISDQPELTFNFQDSSLVVLSRSSSEDSLLLPYDVTHPQSPITTSLPRDESPFATDDGVVGSDAKSDSGISSKPEDILPPPSVRVKSTGGKSQQSQTSMKWKEVKGQTEVKGQPHRLSRTSFPAQQTIQPPTIRPSTRLPQSKHMTQHPPQAVSQAKGKQLPVHPAPVTRKSVQPKSNVVMTTRSSRSSFGPDKITNLKTEPTSLTTPRPKIVNENKNISRSRVSLGTTPNSTLNKSKVVNHSSVVDCRRSLSDVSRSPVPLLTTEALEEILLGFGEVKTTLMELELKLQEAEERELEKDEIIAKLMNQVNSFKTERCQSCGKYPFRTSSALAERQKNDSDEDKISADLLPEEIACSDHY